MSFSGALGGISVRWVKSRVSLQKEPLGLYDPSRGFVFAAEAGDRSELAAWLRHRDVEGAIALR
jgi:hypothetical protein